MPSSAIWVINDCIRQEIILLALLINNDLITPPEPQTEKYSRRFGVGHHVLYFTNSTCFVICIRLFCAASVATLTCCAPSVGHVVNSDSYAQKVWPCTWNLPFTIDLFRRHHHYFRCTSPVISETCWLSYPVAITYASYKPTRQTSFIADKVSLAANLRKAVAKRFLSAAPYLLVLNRRYSNWPVSTGNNALIVELNYKIVAPAAVFRRRKTLLAPATRLLNWHR